MTKFFGRLSKALDKVATVITVALMVFLTILIFAAVLSRFILNNPIAWQYEATLVCLSWVVFIGMSMTFYRKEHMRLTFIINAIKRPGVWAGWMDALDIIVIVFLLIGIKESISVTQSTWSTFYNTIPVRKGLFYLSFPIGAAFSIVHLVEQVLTRRPSDFAPVESKEV